jgi:hypothetical protein
VEWQRDFFDHRLRDHHELQERTSYILMNPVRKGLCERMAVNNYTGTSLRQRGVVIGTPRSRGSSVHFHVAAA